MLASCTSAASSPPARSPAAGIDGPALDAWVERELAPHGPALVAGIVVGDELVWHRGVGARDGKSGAPPDRTSVFRIGSITKVLTATALMQLRERGVLELDTPVATWIPELADRLSPPGHTPVTLRHLVTHTAGIPTGGDGSAPQHTNPTEAALLKALDVPLRFEPGTRNEYSNAGMALAGVVIARATKRSYREYMATEVLAPLGMRPLWDRDEIPAAARVAGSSEGAIDPPTWVLGAFEPAGGLWASLDDMRGLARLVHGAADPVLSVVSRKLMFTDDPLPGHHGVAWIATGDRVSHTGSTADYSATIVSSPDQKISVIILASGGAMDLTDCAAFAIARAVADGKPPKSCAVAAPKRFDHAAQAASFQRLIEFFTAPSEATAKAAFAKPFLARVTLATVLEVAKQLTPQVGACTRYELPAKAPAGKGRVTLVCEKARVLLEYHLESAAPFRLDLLQVIGSE